MHDDETVTRLAGLPFEVRLRNGRGVEWITTSDGREERFTREPAAGLGRRCGAALCSLLPIDWLI